MFPSHYAARLTRWEEIISSDIIASFGREGVPVGHSEVGSLNCDMASIFTPSSSISCEDVPIDAICKDNVWQTWTSQTIKRSYAELELMSAAHEADDRTLVSKAWATGIMPCSEVVAVCRPGVATEAFFVL